MRRFLEGAASANLAAVLLLGAAMHPAQGVNARTVDGPPATTSSPGAAPGSPQHASDPVDSEPVPSPDRRHLAFIRRTSSVPDDFDRFPSRLMLYTMGEGSPRPAAAYVYSPGV